MHPEASEVRVRRLSPRWFAQQPADAKKRAIGVAAMVIGQVTIAIVALTTPAQHSAYYHVHNGLFLVSIMSVLHFFLSKRSTLASMMAHLRWTLTGSPKANLPEIVDALQILQLALVVISLGLVADLEFLPRYGLRVGGVAGVSIFIALRALYQRWKENRG